MDDETNNGHEHFEHVEVVQGVGGRESGPSPAAAAETTTRYDTPQHPENTEPVLHLGMHTDPC